MINEIQQLKASISTSGIIKGNVEGSNKITGTVNNKTVETSDYNKLYNKPKINGVELIGDLNPSDLDIQEEMDYITNMEIERLIGD